MYQNGTTLRNVPGYSGDHSDPDTAYDQWRNEQDQREEQTCQAPNKPATRAPTSTLLPSGSSVAIPTQRTMFLANHLSNITLPPTCSSGPTKGNASCTNVGKGKP